MSTTADAGFSSLGVGSADAFMNAAEVLWTRLGGEKGWIPVSFCDDESYILREEKRKGGSYEDLGQPFCDLRGLLGGGGAEEVSDWCRVD